jgi:alanyl-tRNA synthetase
MEFYKDKNGYSKLAKRNVDTGLGLERMAMLLQGKQTPYEIELFAPVMDKLVSLQQNDDIQSRRIVTEHLRSSMMIINDGGRPSNVDRGYILRRLLRRMTRHLNKLGIDLNELPAIIDISINALSEMYPELMQNNEMIKQVIIDEKNKFMKTLQNGEKEFEKVALRTKNAGKLVIDSKDVFNLYETYGFPSEMTEELAKEQGLQVDMQDFQRLFKEHQDKSRLGSEQKFKGGLASTGEMETKYHTATHLLNAALKVVLGDHVHQKGSNITAERLRFDFSHGAKMTDEEKKEVEALVNDYIKMDIPVERIEMKKEEALKLGAEAMFIEKYSEDVTVYKIGEVSLEFCGGPHVSSTGKLGVFKLKKEEASSAGVRRIKAILE